MSKTIFWHESSANEPSATSRAGRARGRSAAGITAVPVAGGVALFGLSPTGRGRRGGPRHHGTDRPAISGPALLRLAPDGGVAGDPRPCGQSQTGPAPDAVNGAGGDLPPSEHDQASRGAQNLPVLAWRHHDRTGQSGLVFGRHLHPNGQGLPGACAMKYATAMLPARTKATVRVNKPSASSKPPTNSNKPWRPGFKVNRA